MTYGIKPEGFAGGVDAAADQIETHQGIQTRRKAYN
jgi:hypothetical protein